MTPTVSIVIPTFDRSKLLIGALESALAQTFTDYEIIVIDDGSTDDTRERLAPYMDRIRYFYQENRGASTAQNKGIELSRGEWISILASDDLWLPKKLERQLQAVTALGSEFCACFTDCIYMGNPRLDRSTFQEGGLKGSLPHSSLDEPLKYIMAEYPVLCVQSLLVLRSLMEDLHGFDQALILGEDLDLLFRMSFKTRFCVVPTPLVKIDRNPSHSRLTDSLSNKTDPTYACIEYRLRKWLAYGQRLDQATHQTLKETLLSLCYTWAAVKLGRLELRRAFKKIATLRELGEGYGTIVSVLFSRAARKLGRELYLKFRQEFRRVLSR